MPLTYKGTVVSLYIRDLLRDSAFDVGLKKVMYGDQQQIPVSPMCCVEPAQVARTFAGFPFQVENIIRVSIIVYNTDIEGTEAAQIGADEVSEKVADLVNKKSLPEQWGGDRLGGLIVSGHVESHDNGYLTKNDRLMRVNRLVWAGMSKTGVVEPMEAVQVG